MKKPWLATKKPWIVIWVTSPSTRGYVTRFEPWKKMAIDSIERENATTR